MAQVPQALYALQDDVVIKLRYFNDALASLGHECDAVETSEERIDRTTRHESIIARLVDPETPLNKLRSSAEQVQAELLPLYQIQIRYTKRFISAHKERQPPHTLDDAFLDVVNRLSHTPEVMTAAQTPQNEEGLRFLWSKIKANFKVTCDIAANREAMDKLIAGRLGLLRGIQLAASKARQRISEPGDDEFEASVIAESARIRKEYAEGDANKRQKEA